MGLQYKRDLDTRPTSSHRLSRGLVAKRERREGDDGKERSVASAFHNNWITYATGQEREEDSKPCVTRVTIIFFQITFRQTSLSFKKIFL